MARRTRHAIVFDLEFTAWEGSLARGWSRPFELKELVQIGALKIDSRTLKIVDEFEMLVRPRVNPHLSEYLSALTGITNEAMGGRGVDFAVAYRAFLDFAGVAATWAFGRDDLIFEDNVRLYGLTMPRLPYTNVIPWFGKNGVDLTGKHACDVAMAVGASFEGRAHDALADARSVALGITTLVARGASNPFSGDETEDAAPHRQDRDQRQH
jgi:inhibitor of KinA sporulation pathway (predicted exonuclease)